MATRTTGVHALRRRLTAMQDQPGNWRLKGLFLAMDDSIPTYRLGQAWPRQQPTKPRSFVHLGARGEDDIEHGHARQLYDLDAIQAGEVVPRDEYISRMLVNDSLTELDVLWREEILASVEAGAATRTIAREASTVTPVDSRKGTVPIHEQLPFAKTGSEAATAHAPGIDYTPVDYETEKHEQPFALSDELIDEATPDVLESAIRFAGVAVENAINRQQLVTLVDDATQDHTTNGNTVTVKDAFEAMENVTDNDFDPADTMIMHTEFRTEFADQAVFVTSEDTDDTSAIGPELYIASDATYNGLTNESLGQSNTWGWDATDEIGAVVYGRPFVHLVMQQDIEVSEFEPPFTAIHDLQGGMATARTDTVYASTDAISTITQ